MRKMRKFSKIIKLLRNNPIVFLYIQDIIQIGLYQARASEYSPSNARLTDSSEPFNKVKKMRKMSIFSELLNR